MAAHGQSGQKQGSRFRWLKPQSPLPFSENNNSGHFLRAYYLPGAGISLRMAPMLRSWVTSSFGKREQQYCLKELLRGLNESMEIAGMLQRELNKCLLNK